MSTTIEDKIVRIKFDNSEFDKNIAESQKALKSFEESFEEFDKATEDVGKKAPKSFEDINDSAKKLDQEGLSSIQASLNKVEGYVSTLGRIGTQVLNTLTDKAVNTGLNLIKSLSVDQITSGWSKYQSTVAGVQKSISALASVYTDASDEQIQAYINKQLDRLRYFADETSYSLDQMTNTFSSFISAGVNDADKATTAIEGIAMAAAQAGTSISNSAGVFNAWQKAISGGRMLTMQYNQLTMWNKGMDINLQRQLLESAAKIGTIQKIGEDLYSTGKDTVTPDSIRTILDQGVITTEVMIDALSEYGKVADDIYQINKEIGRSAASIAEDLYDSYERVKVNAYEAAQTCKSFEDVIDATKDAVSTQWSNIWDDIFGSYTDAKNLWSELCEYMYDYFVPVWQTLSSVFDTWALYGGRDLLFSDESVYDRVETLKENLEGLNEESQEYKNITAEINRLENEFAADDSKQIYLGSLWNILEGIDDVLYSIADGLAAVFPFFKAFQIKTDTSEQQYELERLQETLSDLAEDSAEYKETAEAIEKIKASLDSNLTSNLKDVAAFLKYIGIKIQEVTAKLKPSEDQLYYVKEAATGIGSALKFVFNIVRIGLKIGYKFLSFANQLLQPVFMFVSWLLAKLKIFEEKALPSKLVDIGKSLSEIGDTISGKVGTILAYLIHLLDTLFKSIDRVESESGGILPLLGKLLSGGLNLIIWALDKIATLLDWIAKSEAGQQLQGIISGFIDIGKNIIAGLFNGVGAGLNKIKEVGSNIANTLIGSTKEGLGIHSPSVVFIAIGGFIIAGLIKGLTKGQVDIIGAIATILSMSIGSLLDGVYTLLEGIASAINVDRLWASIQGLLNIASDLLLRFINWSLSKLAEFVLGPYFPILVATLTTIFTIVINKFIKGLIKSAKGFVDSISGWINAIKDAISQPFKLMQKDKTIEIIKAFAKALLELAAACLILSVFVDWKKLIAGVSSLSILAGVLVGAVILISRFGVITKIKDLRLMLGIASQMGSLSALIMSISGALLRVSIAVSVLLATMKLTNATPGDVITVGLTLTLMLSAIVAMVLMLKKSIAPLSSSSGSTALVAVDKLASTTSSSRKELTLAVLATIIKKLASQFLKLALSISLVLFAMSKSKATSGDVLLVGITLSGMLAAIGILINVLYNTTARMPEAPINSVENRLIKMALAIAIISSSIPIFAMALNSIIRAIGKSKVGVDAITNATMAIVLMLTSVGAIMIAFAKLLNTSPMLTSSKILAFSSSFAIVAAAIFAMSTSMFVLADKYNESPGNLWAVASMIIALLGAVGGILTAIGWMFGNIRSGRTSFVMLMFGATMTGLAVAMNIMAKALKSVAKIANEEGGIGALWTAVGVISVMILVCSAIIGGLGILANYFPIVLAIMPLAAPAFLALGAMAIMFAIALKEIVPTMIQAFKDLETVNWKAANATLMNLLVFSLLLSVVGAPLSVAAGEIAVATLLLLPFKSLITSILIPTFDALDEFFTKKRAGGGDPFSLAKSLLGLSSVLLLVGIALSTAAGMLAVSAIFLIPIKSMVINTLIPTFDALGDFFSKMRGENQDLSVFDIAWKLLALAGILVLDSIALATASIGLTVAFAGLSLFKVSVTKMLIPAFAALGAFIGGKYGPNKDLSVFDIAWKLLGLLGILTLIGIVGSISSVGLIGLAAGIAAVGISLLPLSLAITMVSKPVTELLDTLGGFGPDKQKNAKAALTIIPETFTAVTVGLIDSIKTFNKNVRSLLVNFIYNVCRAITDSATTIAYTISESIFQITILATNLLVKYVPDIANAFWNLFCAVADFIMWLITTDDENGFLAMLKKLMVAFTYALEEITKLLNGPEGQDLKDAFVAFVDVIADWINGEVKDSFQDLLETLEGLKTDFEKLGYTLGNAFLATFDGFGAAIAERIVGTIPDWLLSFLVAVNAIDEDTANKIRGKRTEPISSGDSNLLTYGKSLNARALLASWSSASDETRKNASYVIGGLTMGYDKAMGMLEKEGMTMAEAINEGFVEKMEIASPSKLMARNAGYTVSGFEYGIQDRETEIKDIGTYFAGTYDEAFRNYMGIHSPSEKAAEEGGFTVGGFWDGIKGALTNLWSKIKEFGSKCLDVVKTAFGFGDDQKEGSSSGGIFSNWLSNTFGLSTDASGNIDLMGTIKESLGIDSNASINDILGLNLDTDTILGNAMSSTDDYDFTLPEMDDLAETTATDFGTGTNANSSDSNVRGNAPGFTYNIVQNNYSPTALNTTAIYRMTKSTFSRLEGASVVK